MSNLIKAFYYFIDDLKSVDGSINIKQNYTTEEIKEEIQKNVIPYDMVNIVIFGINIGQIYKNSTITTKKALEAHIELLKSLVISKECTVSSLNMAQKCLPENGNAMPQLNLGSLAGLMNTDSFSKITAIIMKNKTENTTIKDILINVVNSPEFGEIADDIQNNLLNPKTN
jgi:hypothetical protein